MFSHIVVFWTKPGVPNATEDLLAGAAKYLQPIPGVRHFHIGRMAPSQRPVVDQTYQVALNVVFADKKRAGRLPGPSAAPRVRREGLQARLRPGGRL